MAKTLCEWKKKEIEEKASKLAEMVRRPRFFCRRCARVAAVSKVLCKPRRLPAGVTG